MLTSGGAGNEPTPPTHISALEVPNFTLIEGIDDVLETTIGADKAMIIFNELVLPVTQSKDIELDGNVTVLGIVFWAASTAPQVASALPVRVMVELTTVLTCV